MLTLLTLFFSLQDPSAAIPLQTVQEPSAATNQQPVQEPVPVYDEKADAVADLAAAQQRAAWENKRVLLVFGGNWCGWCLKLNDTCKRDSRISRLLHDEYEVVKVDIGRFDKNMNLVPGLETTIRASGAPFLSVLDAAGKPLVHQETSSLEQGKGHDPDKVLAFFQEHTAPPQDARALLAQAQKTALKSGRALFVRLGAPWCGWCHRLDAFLRDPAIAALLEKEFVVLKIDQDRMLHGKKVAAELREGSPGGIPWFAFYNSRGQKIVTSDGPKGNVGCPVQPHEIAHFMNMLRIARQKLTDAELKTISAALEKRAKAIRVGS